MSVMTAVFLRRASLLFPLAGTLALTGASTAHAMDAEVTNDNAAQFYDVRSPTGETVLSRRRLTATLGVGAYNLFDAREGDPAAPDFSFRARLRYDADYGAAGAEQDPLQNARFVPGYQEGPVDLMYAYIEGRRLARGWLGFKAGRQYLTDVLGWWSFDGGEASVTTPFFMKAEVYGGLEQRGGLPLSTPRFEADGIWRGNRTGFDPSLYPSFQPAAIAPAYGAALESTGVTWIHGRLDYRRVYNTGPSNITEFANPLYPPNVYDSSRISSDRLGYSMDASLANIGGAKAGIVYDFYRGDVTSLYASVDAYAGTKVTISADYDYYVPSFDGDSIWNFFAGEPANNLGLRGNVDVNEKLSIAGGGRLRIMSVQTAPFDPFGTGKGYSPSPLYNMAATQFATNGHPFDGGGNLSARWRTGETRVALRGAGDFGDEGERVGADLSAEHIFETRYIVSGRTGVWQWKDELQPDRSTTSFNYVAGLGYRFAPRSQAMIEWEHDINALVGQRFRLLLLLTVAVAK